MLPGNVIKTKKEEKPSYFADWAILIWGVDTVNVALCFPFDEGL